MAEQYNEHIVFIQKGEWGRGAETSVVPAIEY
jgi:hypothetical protein